MAGLNEIKGVGHAYAPDYVGRAGLSEFESWVVETVHLNEAQQVLVVLAVFAFLILRAVVRAISTPRGW